MPKRIAMCTDGTWDDANKHTNVYKIYKAIPTTAKQLAFYDDGVGATPDPVWRFVGGAFGTGIFQKVAEAYAKIAHVYEKDDEIFLFGFSRGAYTARSVAGMIAACGLPTANFSDDMVKAVFNAYRHKDDRQKILAGLKDCNLYAAKIKMVGVWETVGSLGIPSVLGVVDPILYGFLDTGLSLMIQNAYHAVSIDEKRSEFPATLWTSAPAPGQTVEQVWFCGVHSDIGGGEPDDASGATALSDIPLAWMMSKASALGLQIDPEAQKLYTVPLDPKYALDTLHTSWNVLWGFPRHRNVTTNSILANTVRIRSAHDSTYRPPNLAFANGVLSTQYGTDEIAVEPEVAATAGG